MFPSGMFSPEMLIVLIIALLLFGKRLPEVARSMGKGITEFKKGLKGVEEEVRQAASEEESSPARSSAPVERSVPSAPRFEPPPNP